VPYQVYEYLHGLNLREYVGQHRSWTGPRLNAPTALRVLAGILRDLHHPQTTGATPVLHMDIKPSNVMVLQATGEVRLIDFTGARYWRPEEITQVSYTPESGGPEAFGGVRAVSPAYDVHGFGAVAYYLVTGAYPRVDASQSHEREAVAPPWSILRRHPMLEGAPRLRDHLHAPVADQPAARPATNELPGWLDRLGELVCTYGVPDIGVDWHEPRERRAKVVATAAFPQTRVAPPVSAPSGSGRPVSGPPVSGPPVSGPPVSGPSGSGPPRTASTAPVGAAGPAPGARRTSSGAAVNLRREDAAPIRGRASVPPPRTPPRADTGIVVDPVQAGPARPWHAPTNEDPRLLKIGLGYTMAGLVFAFLCWGIWAASGGGNLVGPLIAFLVVVVVAGGLFALSRLIGRLVLVHRLGRPRRSARAAHAVTGVFLAAAGIAYLRQTPWVVEVFTWLAGKF
jgi:hypothetical protein